MRSETERKEAEGDTRPGLIYPAGIQPADRAMYDVAIARMALLGVKFYHTVTTGQGGRWVAESPGGRRVERFHLAYVAIAMEDTLDARPD